MDDETYYAAQKTAEFIQMVRENVRDLRSAKLAPFHEVPMTPSDEDASSRFQESVEFRSESGLPPITESSFASQISPAFGKNTFIVFLNEKGIESEYEEDMFEGGPGDRIPQIPGLTDLIRSLVGKGFDLDADALMATFPGLDLSSEPVKHLRESSPSAWAEEDSIVARRLGKARSFSRLYLEGA